jgi:hypothetical protein
LLKSIVSGIILFAAVFLAFSSSAFVVADSINLGVYSKDSGPYGILYGEWLAKWWNSTVSIPCKIILINITIAEGNFYESPVGTFRGFADGFFVFLEPLPPGRHDVNLKVSVLNPIEPSYITTQIGLIT